MKSLLHTAPFGALLALLTVLPAVQANDEGQANPYGGIAKLNPFNLKPVPPPPPPDPGPIAPSPPLATVELTGVTSLFSKKKALVEIVSSPGKPPLKLTLDEGERVDAIEVLFIDVDKALVTINNAGTVTNLSLKAAQVSAAPATSGASGVLGRQPRGPVPNPTSPAAHFTPTSSGRSAPMLLGGPSAPAADANAAANPVATDTNPSLINRLNRTPAATVDPAVHYINMAAQTQAMQARGIQMPPLPPVAGLAP